MPLAEGLLDASNLPHTISYAVIYRNKINSMNELSDDKRPPRNLWDKPYRLGLFLDEVFGNSKNKNSNSLEFNPEDIE